MKKDILINHIALVIDDSGSMARLVYKTREVVDGLIAGLGKTGRANKQDTRVSVYTFGTKVECQYFDIPADGIGGAADYVHARSGNTALIDAALKAIEDLEEIPTKHGDHSFLLYVITDGEENCSLNKGRDLEKVLKGLNSDWTVAVMVPNIQGKHFAKQVGFDEGNIQIWEVSERGVEEAANLIGHTYTAYAAMRTSGVKSTKQLFKFDHDLTKTEVRNRLEQVDAGEYDTLIVRPYYDGWAIKEFVESQTKGPYRLGSAYYQLTKPEKIQAGKTIAVIEKSTGKMFSGVQARKLLGLPSYEVKVEPADFQKFDLFVQSTSTNRKLVGDTHLIVFK